MEPQASVKIKYVGNELGWTHILLRQDKTKKRYL